MGKKKVHILLGMVKLLITLWMVYQHTQSLQKIQASFLTQLLEKKEITQRFHHEANGDFKTVRDYY